MKNNAHDTAADHCFGDSGYSRERKVALVYMQATGSSVQIFDCNFQPIEVDSGPSIEQNICWYCNGNDNCPDNYHCRDMHMNAIQEAGLRGDSYIYRCELGLMFWVSPIYCDSQFTGALRGSGYLNREPVPAETVAAMCNGTIPAEEFQRRVSAFPAGDTDEIQSLAEMLLLCAESLSSGSENYHNILRLRSRQQASLAVLIEELRVKYPEGSILPGYPLDKERQLLASLHGGDKKEMEKLLNEVLAVLIFCNSNHFRYIQLRALELAVLLVRAGINSGGNIAIENNTRYLRKIQDAKTIEELTGTLHGIMEYIAAQINSFQGIPHALALRKAEVFIR
jgi:ligand-binding sensor protein